MSTNSILLQAYAYVSDHDKFLRLTTISTIVHSMIFVVIVGYNLIYILSEVDRTRGGQLMNEISTIAQQLMQQQHLLGWGVILGIVLAIGYYILPPIGEAAMIYYLEKTMGNNGSVESSVTHGLKKFFVMFEWNSIVGFLSVSSWLIIMTRIILLDIVDEPLMIPVIIIYSMIVLSTVLVTPYVKFKLVVESDGLATAIKESVLLAIAHPTTTLKLALVGLILNLRIIFNVIVLVGVPAILIYLASLMNLHTTQFFYLIVGLVVILLFLLIAYINSIIDAFFMTYWYVGYRSLVLKTPAG